MIASKLLVLSSNRLHHGFVDFSIGREGGRTKKSDTHLEDSEDDGEKKKEGGESEMKVDEKKAGSSSDSDAILLVKKAELIS